MRKAIAILLACVLTPFATHAFEIKGEPGMLYTELRIGSITVTDTKLTSDKGVVELKKMKEIKRKYDRSEEHTSELQSLMRISYAVFCLKKKKTKKYKHTNKQ